MRKKDFLKKYQGKAIHCPTEELANEFLRLCDKFDIKWQNGEKATEVNVWDRYKENTCYDFEDGHIEYCYLEWYELDNYKIIKFESLKNNENLKTDYLEQFNKTYSYTYIADNITPYNPLEHNNCQGGESHTDLGLNGTLYNDLISDGNIFPKNNEINDKKLKTKLKRKKTFTNTQQIYEILKEMLNLIGKLIDKGDEK